MTISTIPPAIMARMAPTFTMVSQNSSSPKIFTLRVLIAAMNRITALTQIQRGVSGNQKPMYTPNAVTSAMATTIISKTNVHPVTNPAKGPR